MSIFHQVRPCDSYNVEYKQCKRMGGRFHQYFIYGQTIDCNTWYKDLKNCQKWTNNEDVKALVSCVRIAS